MKQKILLKNLKGAKIFAPGLDLASFLTWSATRWWGDKQVFVTPGFSTNPEK
jgi:hypothetical protein